MAKDTKNNKDVKKKRFFKDFKAELKKVIWPTPKQIINSTTAVITIVLLTAAIVFVLDLCFDLINEYAINKLKANIKSKTVVESVVENNTNSVEEQVNTVQNESLENVQ